MLEREIDDPHRRQLNVYQSGNPNSFIALRPRIFTRSSSESKAEEFIKERQRLFKPLYIPAVSSPDEPVRTERRF